jgi:hypothetical protein
MEATMRHALTDEEATQRFLALSRWYLLEAHVTTAADGRISIEPPVAAPARGRVAQSLRDNNQPITRPTPATAPRVA